MNRLYIKSRDTAQKTVEGLYKDLERRIVASPPGQCPVDLASAFLKLCHSQSCGKCTPCRVGLGQLQMMIDDILEMNTEPGMETLELLEELLPELEESLLEPPPPPPPQAVSIARDIAAAITVAAIFLNIFIKKSSIKFYSKTKTPNVIVWYANLTPPPGHSVKGIQ